MSGNKWIEVRDREIIEKLNEIKADVTIDLSELYNVLTPQVYTSAILKSILENYNVDIIALVNFDSSAGLLHTGIESNVDTNELKEILNERDKYYVVELFDGHDCALAFVLPKD